MESTFNHIRFKSHGPKQPNSIKISSDNQIAVKVSQSVYILTQNLSSSQQFSFYKTVIKCQQLGSLNLMGTEDVYDYRREMLEKESFHQVDWSPSGCTKRNSCLLIVVSGSSKVYIFGPTNDPYVSKWDKIHDLSVLLVKHYICNENNAVHDFLIAVAACWSDTFQPALITTSTLSSLMATGSKNGSIVIWRIISEFQAFDDSWVILMDFSKWIKDNDEARCFLCAADHKGCVKSFLFKLSFKSDGAIGCEVSLYEEICGGDLRNCQSLLFYKCPYNETAPLCAISKGSRLFVWSTSGNSKTGNSSGTVSSLKIPSNFGTGGLVWGASPDELRVYTIDGKAFKVEVSSRRLKLLLDFTEALRNQAVIFKEHCFVNEEDHDTQDNKKNNYTKDIRIYGVFTTFNCLTDFVLFQVGASSELYYNIAKFDESFFFPLPMHKALYLAESYSPSHLFWDIIIYSQNDANTLVGEAESFFYRFMSILMKGYVDSSAVVEEIVAEENTIGNNYGGHSSWDE
ncbi:hypothetical protein HDU92_006504 [Lobulomyces angularis]|nr:hypothetical protein HDU92_006504 [Lobulomyces angularis]